MIKLRCSACSSNGIELTKFGIHLTKFCQGLFTNRMPILGRYNQLYPHLKDFERGTIDEDDLRVIVMKIMKEDYERARAT